MAVLIVDPLKIPERYDEHDEGLHRLGEHQKIHHAEQLRAVGHACQGIERELPVLQVQVEDEQCEGCGGAGKDDAGIQLLDYDHNRCDHGKRSEDPIGALFDAPAVYEDEDHARDAVQIKDQVGDHDEAAADVIPVPVQVKQRLCKEIEQRKNSVEDARNAGAAQNCLHPWPTDIDDRGGIQEIDHAHQRRQDIVDGQHGIEQPARKKRPLHQHERREDVRAHRQERHEEAALKKAVFERG